MLPLIAFTRRRLLHDAEADESILQPLRIFPGVVKKALDRQVTLHKYLQSPGPMVPRAAFFPIILERATAGDGYNLLLTC